MVAARERARAARMEIDAERMNRDAQIEEAAASYFVQEQSYIAARLEMGKQVQALTDLGQSNARIAALLGTTTKHVRELRTLATQEPNKATPADKAQSTKPEHDQPA